MQQQQNLIRPSPLPAASAASIAAGVPSSWGEAMVARKKIEEEQHQLRLRQQQQQQQQQQEAMVGQQLVLEGCVCFYTFCFYRREIPET